MAHSDIIDKLGGTGALAATLGIKDSAVSMWRSEDRGIPWRWRPRIAQLAKQRKVELPPTFLDPAQDVAA